MSARAATTGRDGTDTPARTGLGSAEARLRLEQVGPNALPGSGARPLHRIVLKVLVEPMFLLLLLAGGLYLALGDRAEAVFLLASVFVVIGITLVQERKTQRALEALRDLSAPRALVLRDGEARRISAREIVPGDLLLLAEGDRIAADADLLEGLLEVDESLLTGEAVAVTRLPGGAHARLCASTVVTKGRGLAEVVATGPATAVGGIGRALATTAEAVSGLQQASRRLIRGLAIAAGLVACAYSLLRWLWNGDGLLDSMLGGIALSMAILPEEIPVVLTVFLAMGAWRMARQRVLARRVPAVEALGAITVLGVDKTGTLTVNRMHLMRLATPGVGPIDATPPLPAGFATLRDTLVRATPPGTFDPMEEAILAFGAATTAGTVVGSAVREYPLTSEVLAMTRVLATGTACRYALACKGAPEAVVGLCGLTGDAAAAALAQAEAMAAQGLRVLGVAGGEWTGTAWPQTQRGFAYRLVGFVGFGDPPRADVPAAIAECRRAGVRVLMLTGDHPATARAIAAQIGLDAAGPVLTGAELDRLDDAALGERLRHAHLCARLRPEQKLRLVRLLQRSGEVVAMTGDGVNDAPALKAADVGIAMGARGTDVAREAAALVLLDDSFASIVAAIRQGRRIYDNVGKATGYVFAVHAPVIALALVPVLLHWPLLLMPVHIVLLQLAIDPACSMVFEAEPEAPDVMRRPPRERSDTPFAPARLAYALLQGAGLAAMLVGGAGLLFRYGRSGEEVRSAVFLGLLGCLFLLVPARRRRWRPARGSSSNPWLAGLLAGLLAIAALALGLPALRGLLAMAPVSLPVAAGSLLMLLASAGWLVVLHAVAGRRSRRAAAAGQGQS